MKKPYIIYGQDGEVVAKLRVGSTRFGRAVRAASAINRYTQGRVFVSQEDSSNPSPSSRYYVSGTTTYQEGLELQQRRNRAQLVG